LTGPGLSVACDAMTLRSYSQLMSSGAAPLAPVPVPEALQGQFGPNLRIDDCYCPIPDCACHRVVLRLWTADERAVAAVEVAMRPPGPGESFARLDLEPGLGQGPHADEFLALLRLGGLDDGLLDSLTERYAEVKRTARELADRGLLEGLVPRPRQRPSAIVGRNEPCPCGSGRKYKRCCLRDEASLRAVAVAFAADGWEESARWEDAVDEELGDEAFCDDDAEVLFGGVHPYVDAIGPYLWEPITEQERAAQEGPGSPAWLRGRSTEELGGLLTEHGVPDGVVRFEELSRDVWFAWDVAEAWVAASGAEGEASDLLGLVAVELWRRLRPDVPCFELLHHRVEEGYDALEEDQLVAACEAWWPVWEALRPRLLGEVADLWEAHEVFPSFRPMQDWWGDLSMVLEVASEADPEWVGRSIEFCRETLAGLPQEEPELLASCWESLGGLHLLAGDRAEAECCLRRGIEEFPEVPGCAIRLAELLARPTDGRIEPAGAAEAVELLREAKRRAGPDHQDPWRLDVLLDELTEAGSTAGPAQGRPDG